MVIHFHATVMIERAGESVVPKVNVSGGSFYASMGFFDGGHNHSPKVLWRQDYYLIIVVLSLVVVCSLREKVCLLVGCASFMMKGEMVFCWLSDPSSLSSVYLLGLSEVLEILVICPDLEVLVCAHEVVPPLFEREHDREEFLVINLIVTFSNREGFRQE